MDAKFDKTTAIIVSDMDNDNISPRQDAVATGLSPAQVPAKRAGAKVIYPYQNNISQHGGK